MFAEQTSCHRTVRTLEGIKLLERVFLKALVNADVAVLDEIWADDYSLTISDGTQFPRKTCLEFVGDGTIKFDTFELEFIGGEVWEADAVIRCRGRATGRFCQEPFDILERHVSIYSKDATGWRQVSTVIPGGRQ